MLLSLLEFGEFRILNFIYTGSHGCSEDDGQKRGIVLLALAEP